MDASGEIELASDDIHRFQFFACAFALSGGEA
jgi:hypothetical protein